MSLNREWSLFNMNWHLGIHVLKIGHRLAQSADWLSSVSWFSAQSTRRNLGGSFITKVSAVSNITIFELRKIKTDLAVTEHSSILSESLSIFFMMDHLYLQVQPAELVLLYDFPKCWKDLISMGHSQPVSFFRLSFTTSPEQIFMCLSIFSV